jgi:hypothetical protein
MLSTPTIATSRLSILAIACLGAGASAQWYNGDPDLADGLAAELNTSVTDAFVFEDFFHTGGPIEELSGNYFWDSNITGYEYELRSGVSNGFAGTLHASANTDGAYSMTPNGFDGFGYLGYHLCADIVDITFAPGIYMLALSPMGDGTGRGFVQSTSGAGGFGSPVDNDLNWFRSSYFGDNYTENYLQGHDYSYGTVCVPAPASVALVCLGGVVARRRR